MQKTILLALAVMGMILFFGLVSPQEPQSSVEQA